MKPMTYKELGEKVAEQALDDYLINGKTMREWINILSDNMSVLEQIRDEIEKVFCISVITNELRTPMEVKTEILQIIDKYRE